MDISATLEAKVQAMAVYESEARPFAHPRSSEALRAIGFDTLRYSSQDAAVGEYGRGGGGGGV